MNRTSQIAESFLDHLFWASLIFAIIVIAYPQQARAQKTAAPQESGGTTIPAPPIFRGLEVVHTLTGANIGPTTHQAQQDPNDPTHAYDSTTGQNLIWDPDKKTWVDSKTGQSVGFDGLRTSDGTIIPAPPIFHGLEVVHTLTGANIGPTTHQAQQDPNDPTRAYDSTTGQNLYWDPNKKTWIDSKTGQSVGFDGVRASSPPQENKRVAVTTPSPSGPVAPSTGQPIPSNSKTDKAGVSAITIDNSSVMPPVTPPGSTFQLPPAPQSIPIGDTTSGNKVAAPETKPADNAVKGGTPTNPPTNNTGPGTAVIRGSVKPTGGSKADTKDAKGSMGGAASSPSGKTLDDLAHAAGLPSPVGSAQTYSELKIHGTSIDVSPGYTWEVKEDGTVVINGFYDTKTVSKNKDGSTSVVSVDREGKVITGLSYTQTTVGPRTTLHYQNDSQTIILSTPDGGLLTIRVSAPFNRGKGLMPIHGMHTYSVSRTSLTGLEVSTGRQYYETSTGVEREVETIIRDAMNAPPPSADTGLYDDGHSLDWKKRPPEVDPSKLPDLTKDLSSGNDTGEKTTDPKASKVVPHDNDKSDSIPKKDDTTSFNATGAGPGGNVTISSATMNAPSLPPMGGGSLLSINSSVSGLVNVALSSPIALGVQNVVVSSVGIQNASLAPLGRTRAAENLMERRSISTHHGSPRLQLVALRETFLSFSSPMAERRAIEEDSWTTDTPNQITYALVANGNSSGEALELQVLDPSGRIKQVELPEGLVLEPLKMGAAQPLSARVPQGANLLTQQLTAYCVDYLKLPPQAGMLYRLAPQAVQDKFKPIASVLRAGRELAGKGQFHPDSDPTAYNDSIRQYSLWTKLENWGEQKFGEVFLEKTKQNAVSAKVKWTKQMEQAVRGLVPGRWRDISMVLDEAAKLSRTSQTAKP